MYEEYVSKFDCINNKIDKKNPLSIGNGNFCFTSDPTGLQTFFDEYDEIPLLTMSNRIWAGKVYEQDLVLEEYKTKSGRKIGYMTSNKSQKDSFNRLRENLFKFNLFNLAFYYEGKKIKIDQIKNVTQRLYLYKGEIVSRFTLVDEEVVVVASVDQKKDILGIVIKSNLLSKGLDVRMEFSIPSPEKKGMINGKDNCGTFISENKISRYTPQINYVFYFKTNGNSPAMNDDLLVFDSMNNTLNLSFAIYNDFKFSATNTMSSFWDKTMDIKLGNYELERRTVLSLYLTKINSAGIYPAAESGLTMNSWYGKFHMEMHLFHIIGLMRFGHADLVFPQMNYYLDIYKSSKIRAISQGYDGARWPKMTDPNGMDSPSEIGCLLVWQEPHIIILLEEFFKTYHNLDLFKKYIPLVQDTLKFMESFLINENGCYYLDEPMISAQECYPVSETSSPLFEVEYFRYAFECGIKFLSRFEIEIPEIYSRYIKRLVKPKTENQLYIANQKVGIEETYYKYNKDHPSFIFAYSFFKSKFIDKKILLNSLKKVLEVWDNDSYWGWDFPMMALAALNCDNLDLAKEILHHQSSKNTFLKNGHNYQRENLEVYLPGNGSLLIMVSELLKFMV